MRFFVCIIILALISKNGFSQEGDTLNYLNILKKPSLMPVIKTKTIERPIFIYNVPILNAQMYYHEVPLKPLKLTMESEKSFANYTSLGFGNLNGIYADAGYGILKDKDKNLYTRLFFNSAKGNLQNQKHINLNPELVFENRIKEKFLKNNFSWFYNKFFYYGYDNARYNYSETQVASQMSKIENRLTLRDLNKGSKKYIIEDEAIVRYINHSGSGKEIGLNVKYNFMPSIKNKYLSGVRIVPNIDLNSYTDNSNKQSGNNKIGISVGKSFKTEKYILDVAVEPALYKTSAFVLPEITYKNIKSSNLHYGINIGSSANLNTLNTITNQTRFVGELKDFKVTKDNHLNLFVFGNAGGSISYHVNLGAKQVKNLLVFINLPDSINNIPKLAANFINSAYAINTQWNLNYTPLNELITGVEISTISFFNIEETTFDSNRPKLTKAYNYRPLQLKMYTNYKPMPKLSLGLSLLGFSGAPKYNNTNYLQGGIDLNISAKYNINNQLSGFLMLNNITNNSIEFISGYKQYGFNGLLGARYLFN